MMPAARFHAADRNSIRFFAMPSGSLNSFDRGVRAMAETHPLNLADEARSEARIADIELGLSHPIDSGYWRDKLAERIRILEEDGAIYGLMPHEERELERLKAISEKLMDPESRQEASDRRRGLHAFSPPPPNGDARHG